MVGSQSLVVMVIKASAASEIRQLIAALGAEDDVRREAAIARLAVLGARAVDRLIAAYESASIGKPGSRSCGRWNRSGIGAGACRSAGAVGRRGSGGCGSVRAARAARFTARSGRHRGARRCSWPPRSIPRRTPGPAGVVRSASGHASRRAGRASPAALQADPDPGLKARAVDLPRDTAAAEAVWQDALEGRLPDAPALLREAAQPRAQAAALSALQKLIDAIRAREGSVRAQAKRTEWQGGAGRAAPGAGAPRQPRGGVRPARNDRGGARPGARSRSSPPCTSSATRRASSRWRPRTPGRARATRGGATSSARRSTRSAAARRSRGGTR